MSTSSLPSRATTCLTHALVLATCVLAACGSDKTSATTTTTGGDSSSTTTTSGNSTVVTNTSSSSKMARQSTDDVQEHADLSESASTGTDDGGGTEPPEDHGKRKGFDMNTNPMANFGNVAADFQGDITLSGSQSRGASVSGKCGVSLHRGGNDNFTIVLNTNVTRTLENNDVITVQAEPNVTITRTGNRAAGTITRTINGKVHRTLTSAKDANASFDLTVEHRGVPVVDLYATANSQLQGRTINGTDVVTDAKAGTTATIVFKDLKRGSPKDCFCPTGGTITQTQAATAQDANATPVTHTYSFGGTCGASTVSLDGNEAVASTTAVGVSGDGNKATGAGVSGSGSVHALGQLSWERCVPTASAN
jgi:hypothetical protein